ATRGSALTPCRHPVVVVAEFVQEDVEELKGPRLPVSPFDDVEVVVFNDPTPSSRNTLRCSSMKLGRASSHQSSSSQAQMATTPLLCHPIASSWSSSTTVRSPIASSSQSGNRSMNRSKSDRLSRWR